MWNTKCFEAIELGILYSCCVIRETIDFISLYFFSRSTIQRTLKQNIMSYPKRSGGNYGDSPAKKPAIKLEPGTPSTLSSKSTQSTRSSIATTTKAFAGADMFDSSDEDVQIVGSTEKSQGAIDMLPHEIDWFHVESLDRAVRTFCDKSDIDKLHIMSNVEKVRCIMLALPPRMTKSLFQGMAQDFGHKSSREVMTFFHDEIDGKANAREKLAHAMVDLLRAIGKNHRTVNAIVPASKSSGGLQAIEAEDDETTKGRGNYKSDESFNRGNDTGKTDSTAKKAEVVSFSSYGGGVVVHKEHGSHTGDGVVDGQIGLKRHSNLDETTDDLFREFNEGLNGDFSGLTGFFDNGNDSRKHSDDQVPTADNSNVAPNIGLMEGGDAENSDEADPLGDADFSNVSAPAMILNDSDKFNVVWAKPVFSRDRKTGFRVFFLAGRNKGWWLKPGFLGCCSNLMIKHIALTNPNFAANMTKTLVPSFAESNRRIPHDVQDRLMKTVNGRTIPIVFGVVDFKANESDTFEQKAQAVFDVIFKGMFKSYPNAKVNRGRRFLNYCNENGMDGLATFLVGKYGDGDETNAANALSMELNACFNNPGVRFEWNAPLDKFLIDYEIKRFLVNYTKATGWDDLTDSDKEACYRAYNPANPNRLPNWNAMVKPVHNNNN